MDIQVSPGELSDLLVAWSEGEISEGRLVEVSGIDRLTLRLFKGLAIKRAAALCTRPCAGPGESTADRSG